MKSYGANTYRFSLAWPRIIPLGGRDDPINEQGIAFYNAVIDECLRLGMKPFVTLFQCVFPVPYTPRTGLLVYPDRLVIMALLGVVS
jgi:beta-glucosidase